MFGLKRADALRSPVCWLSPPRLGGPNTAPAGSPNPEGDKVGAAWVCLCSYRELWTSQGCVTMGNVKHGTPCGGGGGGGCDLSGHPGNALGCLPPSPRQSIPGLLYIYIVPCFAANSTHLVSSQ